jgi:prepilin-type N-terminal cleavage/methylation domain-containing protein
MIKKAFSLIELVVSIVIIGIVSMSFPLILTQTSNNVAFAMQQEAILATKTYMGTILSYPWDQNSIFVDGGNYRGIVLNVNTGNDLLKQNETLGDAAYRRGHIIGDSRRRMMLDPADLTNAIAICETGNATCQAKPSINGFDNAKQNLTVIDGTKNIDSILKLTLTPTISYVDDKPVASDYTDQNISFKFGESAPASTNIKRVSISATNSTAEGHEINIVLRAYSSNIGEFQLPPRDY